MCHGVQTPWSRILWLFFSYSCLVAAYQPFDSLQEPCYPQPCSITPIQLRGGTQYRRNFPQPASANANTEPVTLNLKLELPDGALSGAAAVPPPKAKHHNRKRGHRASKSLLEPIDPGAVSAAEVLHHNHFVDHLVDDHHDLLGSNSPLINSVVGRHEALYHDGTLGVGVGVRDSPYVDPIIGRHGVHLHDSPLTTLAHDLDLHDADMAHVTTHDIVAPESRETLEDAAFASAVAAEADSKYLYLHKEPFPGMASHHLDYFAHLRAPPAVPIEAICPNGICKKIPGDVETQSLDLQLGVMEHARTQYDRWMVQAQEAMAEITREVAKVNASREILISEIQRLEKKKQTIRRESRAKQLEQDLLEAQKTLGNLDQKTQQVESEKKALVGTQQQLQNTIKSMSGVVENLQTKT